MEANRLYEINVNALKSGVYNYSYQLDDAFFRGLEQDEVAGGSVCAEVSLTVMQGGIRLHLAVKGGVKVTCDRCLDLMTQPVCGEDDMLVKAASEPADADDSEVIYVDPDDGRLDLAWLFYELIETNLPLVHCHQPGGCNPQMEELLLSHLCTTAEEPEDN